MKQEEAQIILSEDKYISKKPSRCTTPEQTEIDSQISNLQEFGLIEETYSPFTAPVILVCIRKKMSLDPGYVLTLEN